VGLINSTEDLSGPAARGSIPMEDTVKICEESPEQIEQRARRKQRSAVGTPDYLAPEILLGTSHGMHHSGCRYKIDAELYSQIHCA
jgi:serine/threonine protein kinase